MIVGEYEQRDVYKRYNVVDNGPDSVLETSGVIYLLISKYSRVSMAVMSYILFAHTLLVVPGTGDTVMT